MNSEDSDLPDKVSLHGQLLRYIETLNSQNFRMIAIFSSIITLASVVIAFFTNTDIDFDPLLVKLIIICSVFLTIILSFVGSIAVFNNWQSVMSYREMLSRISQQINYISSSKIDLQDVNWHFSGPTTPQEYWLSMKGIVRFRVAVVFSLLNIVAFLFLGFYTEKILLHTSIGVIVSFIVFYFSWFKKVLPLNSLKRKTRMTRYLKNERKKWVNENIQKFHSEKLTNIYSSESSYRNVLNKKSMLAIQEIINRKIVTKCELRKLSKANLCEEIENLRKTSKANLCEEIENLRKTSKANKREKIKNLRKTSKVNKREKIKNLRKTSKANKREEIKNLRKTSRAKLCNTLKEHKKTPKKKLRTEMIEFLKKNKEALLDSIQIKKVED